MRSTISQLAFAVGSSALAIRSQQCVQLVASGGASGTLGQYTDGQNRIGGGYPDACYCLDSAGGFTDTSGRGCILTPPTTQFQCDSGASPTNGFAINGGSVTYNGDSTFYACPYNSNGGYNVYTQPVEGQSKCVKIALGAGQSCGAGAQSSASKPAPAPSMSSKAAPPPAMSSKPAPAPPMSSYYAAPPPAMSSKPAPPPPAMSSKPAPPPPAMSTKYAPPPPPAMSSKPAPPPPAMSSKPAPPPPAMSSKPAPPPPAVTSGGYKPAPPPPAMSSKPAPPPPAMSSKPAPAPPMSSKAAPAPPMSSKAAPAPPMASQPANSCPANLSGSYQYPHLIVPVSSSQPSKVSGTSYNGMANGDVCSLFNFDIPQSYAGHTCSLVFLFPEQKDLTTSSYTVSGAGSLVFSKCATTATQSTSWDTKGECAPVDTVAPVAPGNSYTIVSGACAAGQTVTYEMCATGGLALEYFQDYNPSPIGAYITEC